MRRGWPLANTKKTPPIAHCGKRGNRLTTADALAVAVLAVLTVAALAVLPPFVVWSYIAVKKCLDNRLKTRYYIIVQWDGGQDHHHQKTEHKTPQNWRNRP